MNRVYGSPFIDWAKARSGVRYHLGASGVPRPSSGQLAAHPADFEVAGDNLNGWPPLIEHIAGRYGIEPEGVAFAHGTTMANHLACAALLEPGDHVLVESPVYEPLQLIPRLLGAEVSYFERPREDGFALSLDSIGEQLRPDTRLVIVSNLHNPTGSRIPSDTLQALARLTTAAGVRVLIDEIYLECFRDGRRESAARLSPAFVCCRGLTKAWGLDGLRSGWVLTDPHTAERIRRVQALFNVVNSHPCERLSLRALQREGEILKPTLELLARNFNTVKSFIDSEERLDWIPPEGGPVAWVRLLEGSVDELVARLESKWDTTVAPGRFFGDPGCFRLGFGVPPEILVEGLKRLAHALRE